MLVGLTGQALTSGGGFGAALVAFGAAALTLVALMFGLAMAIATAQERTVERLRGSGPTLRRWGGTILVVVGAWFLLLGIVPHPFTHIFHV